jgi:hypothetical protein
MKLRIFLVVALIVVISVSAYKLRADLTAAFIKDYKEAELKGGASPETYAKMIVVKDPEIRSMAESITERCAPWDKACMLYFVYMYMIDNYQYIDDLDGNVISGVNITIRKKGGDCEDLSILLASLLENLEIFTILAVQVDHVFVYACGVSRDEIYETIIKRDARFRELRFRPEDISLYDIDGFKCIPLDPSNRWEFAYPGLYVSGDTLFTVYPRLK